MSKDLTGIVATNRFDFGGFDSLEVKLIGRAIHRLHEPREGVGEGSIEIKDDEFVFGWNPVHVLRSVRVAFLGIDAEFLRGLLDKLRVDFLLAKQFDERGERDVTRIDLEEVA